jgi:arylsulfatase A-like enzyme
MKRLLLVIALVLSMVAAVPLAAQTPAARAEYVVIVTIDGARPDGLRTTNITPILQEGAFSMSAQTTVPPITAPAHMSLVSGVGPDRHGVRDNTWRPGSPYPSVPTIFSVAKSAGLRTSLFTQKNYVLGIANPQFMDKAELLPARGATITADLVGTAAGYIRAARPHVSLVHIAEPDIVGHAQGWMSFGYLQSLRRAVDGVQVLRAALRDAGIDRQTLLIITADHGGIERDHVAVVPEVLTIPWIALGPGVRPGAAIERRIVIYDTAATVLHALGLATPAGWEGRPVVEIYAAAAPVPTTYPVPSAGVLTRTR